MHLYFPAKINSLVIAKVRLQSQRHLKLSSTSFLSYLQRFSISLLPLLLIVSPYILISHYPSNSGSFGRSKIDNGKRTGKTKPLKLNLREIWLASQREKLCLKKVGSHKNSQIPIPPEKSCLTAVIVGRVRTTERSHGTLLSLLSSTHINNF